MTSPYHDQYHHHRPARRAIFTLKTILFTFLCCLVLFSIQSSWIILKSSPSLKIQSNPFDNNLQDFTAAVSSPFASDQRKRSSSMMMIRPPPLIHMDNDEKKKSLENLNVTQFSTTQPIKKKKLPSMERGGFVFFLHVPKTGGSTIRWNLQRQEEDINYRFVSGMGLYNQSLGPVWQYLTTPVKRKRKIFFLEVHGRDSPPLLELQERLQTWKRQAAQNEIPTFYFTILRDPISFALSYFNFFHVQRGPNPHFDQVQPTEDNLLQYSLYNPQCQFLARGENSLRMKPKGQKQTPTVTECQMIHNVLVDNMDWVGTTEAMNNETLPILKYVLGKTDRNKNNKNNNSLEFHPLRISNKSITDSISLNQLSALAVTKLKEKSTLDHELYTRMRSHYVASIWEGF